MSLKEELYVFKRKCIAFGNTLAMLVCRVFPIDNKKIVFVTFEGKGGFGCNPKYIARELHRRNDSYTMVWLVDDLSKEFPDYIEVKPYFFWSRNYHLATAKIWVNNYRNPYGTIKRRNQYYFHTWHASMAFKRIGLCRGEAFSKMAYLVSKNDSDMIDCVCSDSDWWSTVIPKGLIYDGPIIKSGLPRNDDLLLRRNEIREELRDRYKLDQNVKIALYAPTFRESANNGKRSVSSNNLNLDFSRVLRTLEDRFDGKWVLFLRLHPQLANSMDLSEITGSNDNCIDVSKDDDMYRILPGVDFYISDYSAAIFEAELGRIPAIMYAEDLDDYIRDRGGLCFDFNVKQGEDIYTDQEISPGIKVKLPFPVARNLDDLENCIKSFDLEEYYSELDEFDRGINVIRDGHASERVADWIEAHM